MKEQWRPVAGFEGLYEVSDQGRLRSLSRRLPFKSKAGKWHTRLTKAFFLSQHLVNSGYLVAHLYKDRQRTARTVHSLVAAAFLGPRPAEYDVAHYDGIRTNNAASNLRYATRSENLLDMRRHGTGNYPRA